MSGGLLGLVVGLLFIAMQLPQYARTMTCCGSGSWGCGVAVASYACVPTFASYPLFNNVMITF